MKISQIEMLMCVKLVSYLWIIVFFCTCIHW